MPLLPVAVSEPSGWMWSTVHTARLRTISPRSVVSRRSLWRVAISSPT